MRKLGLFIIFLIASLSFVPALNNSNFSINDTLTNDTVLNDTIINDTNNDTIEDTNTDTKIVVINFPKFNYLDYFTPVDEPKKPLTLDAWNEFEDKKSGLISAVDNYINWTEDVSKIANESFNNGENPYDSGFDTRFRYVPSSVMKSVYEQDTKIDAAFSQVSAYYAMIDAAYNIVVICTATIATVLTAVTAFVTAMIVLANTAATAVDVATMGTAAPAAETARIGLTKAGAAIICLCVALSAIILVTPAPACKAELASKKAEIEKWNVKYQKTHAEAKIEVPRLSDGSSNIIDFKINSKINKPIFKDKNKNDSKNTVNNTTNETIIVTPGFEYTDSITISDINKIKTNAIKNFNQSVPDYNIKQFLDWNPSSWTDSVKKPVWDPPKIYKGWKVWLTIIDVIKYAAYAIWYGLQMVAYGVAYATTFVAYIVYWMAENFYICMYNMGKLEALMSDLKEIEKINI